MGTSCTEKADIYSCGPACLGFALAVGHAPHPGQHAAFPNMLSMLWRLIALPLMAMPNVRAVPMLQRVGEGGG